MEYYTFRQAFTIVDSFRQGSRVFDMRLEPVPVKIFQDKTVPGGSHLAGWAALVQALGIAAPVRRPSCVSKQHVRGSHRTVGDWVLFDKRYWPGEEFADQLTFALRHEDIDLLVLKRAFDVVHPLAIQAMVRATPTGVPARRAWVLY